MASDTKYVQGPLAVCVALLVGWIGVAFDAIGVFELGVLGYLVLGLIVLAIAAMGVREGVATVGRFRARKDPLGSVSGRLDTSGFTFTSGEQTAAYRWPELVSQLSSRRILILQAPDAAYLLPRSVFRDDQDWKTARRLARDSLRSALPAKSRHNLRIFVGGTVLVVLVWCTFALPNLFSTP